MFTGLIEDIGTVARIERGSDNFAVTVRTSSLDMSDVALGESIAVDGACFTVVRWDASSFTFEASPESLARTTLDMLNAGDRVHLERAMKVGGRLGGHMVQGHVDGVGTVQSVERGKNAWTLTIGAPREIMNLVVSKGSIAVDGVSLTVNEVTEDALSVAVIPHTAGNTKLTSLLEGKRVNLETDIIGKYVWRFMGALGGEPVEAPKAGGVDLAMLMQYGFVPRGD
jgi:riboflavin synthase